MESKSYGVLGGDVGQTLSRPHRPMERISTAANRVEEYTERLISILERFHGPQPQAGSSAEGDPIMVSYLNNVDRLHVSLDRLEAAVSTLNEIA